MTERSSSLKFLPLIHVRIHSIPTYPRSITHCVYRATTFPSRNRLSSLLHKRHLPTIDPSFRSRLPTLIRTRHPSRIHREPSSTTAISSLRRRSHPNQSGSGGLHRSGGERRKGESKPRTECTTAGERIPKGGSTWQSYFSTSQVSQSFSQPTSFNLSFSLIARLASPYLFPRTQMALARTRYYENSPLWRPPMEQPSHNTRYRVPLRQHLFSAVPRNRLSGIHSAPFTKSRKKNDASLNLSRRRRGLLARWQARQLERRILREWTSLKLAPREV
jgi:hypothetical protein